jgi:hypothetical protein
MAAALLLLTAACASAPERLTVREVDVPTPTACAPKIGPAPDYPDTDAALAVAPGLFERVQRLLAGRLLRIAREGELTAALGACEGGGGPDLPGKGGGREGAPSRLQGMPPHLRRHG